MKKLIIGLTVLASSSSFASVNISTVSKQLKEGKINLQEFVDTVDQSQYRYWCNQQEGFYKELFVINTPSVTGNSMPATIPWNEFTNHDLKSAKNIEITTSKMKTVIKDIDTGSKYNIGYTKKGLLKNIEITSYEDGNPVAKNYCEVTDIKI